MNFCKFKCVLDKFKMAAKFSGFCAQSFRSCEWMSTSISQHKNRGYILYRSRDISKNMFLLIIAPPRGQTSQNFLCLPRTRTRVYIPSLVFIRIRVSEIQPHFLFGRFPVKFDWLLQLILLHFEESL